MHRLQKEEEDNHNSFKFQQSFEMGKQRLHLLLKLKVDKLLLYKTGYSPYSTQHCGDSIENRQ